jgi:general secretion pathway protein A
VFRLSQGVPRVINVICDRALLGAYSLDRHRVTAALVRNAAAEVFGRRFTPHWLPWALIAGAAALALVLLIALWRLEPWNRHAAPPLARSTAAQAAAAVPAAAAPQTPPAARVAAAAAPALAELLKGHAAETDTDGAFAKLFGLWGAKYQASTIDPCTQAHQQGLECIAERGSFGQLRLYNHPAILLLTDSTGATHQVVLTALTDDEARLDLGGAQSVGLGELSRYWLGDFVMLWRPANSPVKPLSAGMRGEQVRWLRQSLQNLHGGAGVAAGGGMPVSDLFDADLTAQVRDFQRQHQLTVDGIAGVQTQIALASAVASPGTPLLSAIDTHHGG